MIRVIIPQAMPKALDYTLYSAEKPQLYSFVEVPVGKKWRHGLIVDINPEDAHSRLKEAFLLPDVPSLAPAMGDFLQWVTKYTMAAPGDALRALLLKSMVPERPLPLEGVVLESATAARITPQRRLILEALEQMEATRHAYEQGAQAAEIGALCEETGVSRTVVNTMVQAGILAKVPLHVAASIPQKGQETELNAAQQAAADHVFRAIQARCFSPMLLDGVTGSGKTEVYFDVLERLLAEDADGQVLMLLPEIALTPQWLKRFSQRFGFEPVIWHSGVGEAQKRKGWWQVHEGLARVVVGARSALFLPFRDLRFLVVDEEHDSSYKQEDMFRYHGRDMAVVAAKMWQATVVLASATPSLETWHNMQSGRYVHLQLPSRYGTAVLPDIACVDVTKNAPKERQDYLTPPLEQALADVLERGEQAIVFINRRGFAPVLLCRSCGHRHECPRCDSKLVVHGSRLKCHYCGYQESHPDRCTKCGDDTLSAYGPGTRRIHDEIQRKFPEARLCLADSDAVADARAMGEVVRQMAQREADILIGTQMVAKGHDFPHVTFVGVIDASLGLGHADLRAAERSYQLLTQVAGRAGRAGKKGHVLLQTLDPAHAVFDAVLHHKRDAFYEAELKSRATWQDPPFGHLIALLITSNDLPAAEQYARALAQALSREARADETIWGPAPAAVARIKHAHRLRVLVKSPKPAQKLVLRATQLCPPPSGVRLDVDVDPMTLL